LKAPQRLVKFVFNACCGRVAPNVSSFVPLKPDFR
jgi:hypothetical protein